MVDDKERSVAGAWNRGMELAMDAGIEQFLISAVDVGAERGMIDALLGYGERHAEASVWSSCANGEMEGSGEEAVDRCDFSCFMMRRGTLERHGWFDREYKPAYFEDNDYVTRVVLGGQEPKQVTAARHRHEGSLTIKLDPEMAGHVRHWFGVNAARFRAKWGEQTDDYAVIREKCFKTPGNSGRALSWWAEQDHAGYLMGGGIHSVG